MTTNQPTPDYSTVALYDGGEQSNYVQQMQSSNTFVYQIKGRPAFAFGDIWLQQGQRIIADSSSFLWMDGDVTVETGMVGGCCASYLRQCSGEPCCFNTYIGTGSNQKVSVGFELPGDIMAFGVTKGNGWCLTYDAFVAGTDNLVISTRFSGCCVCCCGDETPFLTTATVKDNDMGILLAGGYGMIERHDVKENQTLCVSRGLFFAARQDSPFQMGLVGGCMNLCCTGGGIVIKFQGPCCVYTQSKNPVQLLRDFGIPGGRRGAQGKAFKIVISILKGVLNTAGSASG